MALWAVAANPSAAQPDLPPSTPAAAGGGSAVVQALEVVAQPPGPALWRVSRGASEVVVLGAVSPLPHALTWDTARVARALDGAKALLAPPKPTAGVVDIVRLALVEIARARLPRERPLDTLLTPSLRARLAEATRVAQQDPGRYARWKPLAAGLLLINDYRRAAGLSDAKPGSTVEKLAKAAHVPVRPVGEFRLASLVRTAASQSQAVGLSCLSDAVDQVMSEAANGAPAAQAWARGDLKGVRAHYGAAPLERCIAEAPDVAAVLERGTAQSAAAILAALQTPGRSVAVVDLRLLLRADGVLDRVKAAGADVTVPQG